MINWDRVDRVRGWEVPQMLFGGFYLREPFQSQTNCGVLEFRKGGPRSGGLGDGSLPAGSRGGASVGRLGD